MLLKNKTVNLQLFQVTFVFPQLRRWAKRQASKTRYSVWWKCAISEKKCGKRNYLLDTTVGKGRRIHEWVQDLRGQ